MKCKLLILIALFFCLAVSFADNYCVGATQNFSFGSNITENCTLNGNVTGSGNGFTIGSSNIVVDCNGYSIVGDREVSTNGIINYGNNQITIKNCYILNFGAGIGFINSINGSITNNTVGNLQFPSNGAAGIALYSSSNIIIANNIGFNNFDDFIALVDSNNILIVNNIGNSSSGELYWADDSNNLTLINNTAYNTMTVGFKIINGHGNILINNTAISAGAEGFWLNGASNNTLINNLISQNVIGIRIDTNSTNNLFINNSNELEYSGADPKFYSDSAQNVLSEGNIGWWPLLNSDGSDAGGTAWYDGDSGGRNGDGSANSSLHYWFGNSLTVISSSISPSPVAAVTATLLGSCYGVSHTNSTRYYYNWYLNGELNRSGVSDYVKDVTVINPSNISSDKLAVGQNWILECTVNNGAYNSTPLNSTVTYIEARCIGATQDFSYGDTINESCTLNGNLSISGSDGFDIGASDIVIDGKGYTITGDGIIKADRSGIYNSGYNNVTIKNFNIYNFVNGMYIQGTSNNALVNNTVYNSPMYGFKMDSDSNATFINNIAINTSQGFRIINSADNLFINNINEIDYVAFGENATQMFYSDSPQNTSSNGNIGWWPLLTSDGSDATSQDMTAWYGGTLGGMDADGTPNSSLHYWYNNTFVAVQKRSSKEHTSNPIEIVLNKTISCPDNSLTATAESEGKPVENAYVKLFEGTKLITGAKTDSSGNAYFTLPVSASYDIEAEKVGYEASGLVFDYTLCILNLQENQTNQTNSSGQLPQCTANQGCSDTQYCNNRTCVNVTGECGFASNHSWISYQCCADSDCGGNQTLCVLHECKKTISEPPADWQVAIDNAQSAIDGAHGQGKNTTAAQSLLNQARVAADAGNYTAALDLANQAKNLALNAAASGGAQENQTGATTATTQSFNWWLILVIIILCAGYYFYSKRKM